MLSDFISVIGLVGFGVMLTLVIVFFPRREQHDQRTLQPVPPKTEQMTAAPVSVPSTPTTQEVSPPPAPPPAMQETVTSPAAAVAPAPTPEQPFFAPSEDPEPEKKPNTEQADKILDIAKNMLTMAIHESVRMSHDEQRTALVLEQLSNIEQQILLQQTSISEVDSHLQHLTEQLTTMRADSVILRPEEPMPLSTFTASPPRASTTTAQEQSQAPGDRQQRVRPAPRPTSTGTISPVKPQS